MVPHPIVKRHTVKGGGDLIQIFETYYLGVFFMLSMSAHEAKQIYDQFFQQLPQVDVANCTGTKQQAV